MFEQGKVTALTVVLTNYDRSKTVNITGLVDSINVIEDIFKNTLYGSMQIIDGINLLGGAKSKNKKSTFPILGEEFIEISYAISWSPQPINVKLRFFVYSVSEIEYGKNSTMKNYTLKFCSEENLLDSITIVQKGYTGKHSDSAKSILNDYLFVETPSLGIPNKKAKKIFIQPTKGIQNVCIPRLTPLQAVQFLAKRSIAEDVFTSGSYVFFESFEGFHFCDIEHLISEGIKKAKGYDKSLTENKPQKSYLDSYTYYFEEPTLSNKKDRNQKTIITMTHKNRFDTIEKLKYGMFQSIVLIYDYINKRIVTNTFNFLDSNKNRDGNKTNNSTLVLGDINEKSYPENSITFMKRYTAPGDYSRSYFIPKDFSTYDTFLEQVYANRASYFTRLSQNMFTIDTLGNPNINAGDVIYINVPSGDGGGDRNDSNDKLLTGYYLVCTISHKISRTTYVTTMDIYRNGFSAKIEATDEDRSTEVLSENNSQKRLDFAAESIKNVLPADSQLGRIMKNLKDLLPPKR